MQVKFSDYAAKNRCPRFLDYIQILDSVNSQHKKRDSEESLLKQTPMIDKI
jgi:hypothetical protein